MLFKRFVQVVITPNFQSFEKNILKMAEKTALILLVSEGAEEMEVVITGDVLVRGGVKVTYAGCCGPDTITCAKGLKIVPDVALEKVKGNKFDLVVLPGGPGSSKLGECPLVGQILKEQQQEGRLIGAICAAPTSLMAHGIKADLVTSHPSVKDKLKEGGYSYSEDRVVVSGKVVTSRGPGTAFEFGLKLVELLNGAEKAKSLIEPMVLQGCGK